MFLEFTDSWGTCLYETFLQHSAAALSRSVINTFMVLSLYPNCSTPHFWHKTSRRAPLFPQIRSPSNFTNWNCDSIIYKKWPIPFSLFHLFFQATNQLPLTFSAKILSKSFFSPYTVSNISVLHLFEIVLYACSIWTLNFSCGPCFKRDRVSKVRVSSTTALSKCYRTVWRQ